MPASLKLLLRPGVLRGEQGREKRIARSTPWHKQPHSPPLARKVEGCNSGLQPSPKLRSAFLPSFFQGQAPETYEPGLWTRYGRWNAEGTKVFNQRGKVIYEFP